MAHTSKLDETKLSTGVQSPFLPGTNVMFAWDSTCLGMLKTCPRLYKYTIIDGYSPKGESIHLRFGGEYHSALEAYDHSRATGKSHEDSIHVAVLTILQRTVGWDVDPDTKAGKYKNRKSLLGLVVDYLDHFGGDDPAQTVILSNGKPAVELSFRFELDFGPRAITDSGYPQPYLLCGHLDRVVNFNDQMMVMDRKTSTYTLSSTYFKQYEPNNQMTLYTLAGQVVMETAIKGVIIDAAQIMLTEPNRFVRGMTFRSTEVLEEWTHDLRIFLDQAEAYATAEYWPMNDTSCDKFGGCRFREVCSKSPAVRERFLAADFTKLEPEDRWNPLKSR